MKKIYLLLTSLLMMGSATSYGQDYYDIAAPGVAEIVDLYWHISGDTTDTGDRVSDNRVYRLERGGRYLMKYSEPFDFSFAIIAGDATDTGDGSGRPPVIERGRYESG
ncbi:MAG: hypothetical protein KAH32_07670, partial [Chlamydiia bacterium]|nr:hypothetical protein [Chlamydiia bacterium]